MTGAHLGLGRESDTPKVHDGKSRFAHRFYKEAVPPRMIEFEFANVATDKSLKTAGVLDHSFENLFADGELDLTAAASFAAALENFDLKCAGLVDGNVLRADADNQSPQRRVGYSGQATVGPAYFNSAWDVADHPSGTSRQLAGRLYWPPFIRPNARAAAVLGAPLRTARRRGCFRGRSCLRGRRIRTSVRW